MLKDNLEKVVQQGKRTDSTVKNVLLHSCESSGEVPFAIADRHRGGVREKYDKAGR